MEHSFDIDLAKELGVNSAILLRHFSFWLAKNEANNANFYDGSYWTYNSISAYSKLFPYLSEKQVRSAIQNLVDKGILKTGNYNKSAYDRTLWYALTDYGKSILPYSRIHLPCRENGDYQKGEPIPDSITTDNRKTDIYTDSSSIYSSFCSEGVVKNFNGGAKKKESRPFKEVVDYLNLKAGTSYRPTSAKTQSLINARFNEGFTLDDFKKVIDIKTSMWKGSNYEQYLRPETLFGTKFESYLNQKPKVSDEYNNPNLYRDDSNVDPEDMWNDR